MINHKSSSCHLKAHKMSACLSVCTSASANTHIHAVRTFIHWRRWWLTPLSPPLRPTHSASLSYQKPSQWNPLSTCSYAMRLLWSHDSSIAPLVHYCDEWTNGLNRIVKTVSRSSTNRNFMYWKWFKWQSKCAVNIQFMRVEVLLVVEPQYAINTN